MCGITGFLETSPRNNNDLIATATRMNDALHHRGPDDGGVWTDADAAVALCNRRLAIIDLSLDGHQPMHSADGRFVIAFNGEIYNYRELRSQLEGSQTFRGHSDTETLLAAISKWGVREAIQKAVGMFAISLWDRRERKLFLIRDRIGEKPLYYGWMGDAFLFGSEIKALRQHPAWHGDIDRDVTALYLRHNYIPGPYSIFKNIFKLPPGAMLTLSLASSRQPKIEYYWSAREAVERNESKPFAGNERQATDELERLLRQSIAGQMIADVPLGVFLSGGVDSSVIAALMQTQSDQPVKTYTMGFHAAGYNEAEYAKAVAQHLKTDHTEMYVTPEDALAVIPRLPTLYDEPFADSSQIPTFLVSQLARQHVTVILSGDAGDELFAGYARYAWSKKLWSAFGWSPLGLRRLAAQGLAAASPLSTSGMIESIGSALSPNIKRGAMGNRLQQVADMLVADRAETLYKQLISYWKEPTQMVLGSKMLPTVLTERNEWASVQDFIQRLMYLDLVMYLPDDILVKVDRASMGVSLETRAPYLDHRLIEFAWSVPLSMKIRDGQSKWLLRQVLYKYVPSLMIERPKMGFGVPIDLWLRGALREWAEELLDERQMREEGFFDPKPIQKKWREHLSGRYQWQYYLWGVLMFQAWKREWKA